MKAFAQLSDIWRNPSGNIRMCKRALSAQAENVAAAVAELACPAEVFEDNAANSSMPTGGEICVFGNEEGLAKKPRCSDRAESAGASGHQDIEEERKLLVRGVHGMVRQQRKNQAPIPFAQPARDHTVETAGQEVCIGVEEQKQLPGGALGALITCPRLACPSGGLRAQTSVRERPGSPPPPRCCRSNHRRRRGLPRDGSPSGRSTRSRRGKILLLVACGNDDGETCCGARHGGLTGRDSPDQQETGGQPESAQQRGHDHRISLALCSANHARDMLAAEGDHGHAGPRIHAAANEE